MSTTGIVRRIDDLGRVVIPKEIRKTLRIKDGEALEIEVIDNNIVLKKYSSMIDIKNFLNIFIEEINRILNEDIFIIDRDKIIYGSGDIASKYIDKHIADSLYNLMVNRKNNVIGDNNLEITNGVFLEGNYIFSSIIPNGDVAGGVIILSKDSSKDNSSFLNMIVKILTKYIEE